MIRHAAALLMIAAFVAPIIGQPKTPKPESPAKLELSFEVATTGDDGYPSALRITISNVRGVAVDMPVLPQACLPDNGFRVEEAWTPDEPTGHGFGSGFGCGMEFGPNLPDRIEHEWVRLRPGESMTTTTRLRFARRDRDGPGTEEYWVEYTPPALRPEEIARLSQAGYVIPVEGSAV
jgi:hypothetical protein